MNINKETNDSIFNINNIKKNKIFIYSYLVNLIKHKKINEAFNFLKDINLIEYLPFKILLS